MKLKWSKKRKARKSRRIYIKDYNTYSFMRPLSGKKLQRWLKRRCVWSV